MGIFQGTSVGQALKLLGFLLKRYHGIHEALLLCIIKTCATPAATSKKTLAPRWKVNGGNVKGWNVNRRQLAYSWKLAAFCPHCIWKSYPMCDAVVS